MLAEDMIEFGLGATAARRGYSLALSLPMPCCEGTFRFRSSRSIMNWTRRIAKSSASSRSFRFGPRRLSRTAKPKRRLASMRAQR